MGETFSKEIINEDNQEYFDLINKKIKNENSNQTNENSNGKKRKYWKNVILHYLDKQYKIGIDWALELFNLIKKTKFNNEQKFLDLFIWQKFEIRTKPDCLNNNNNNKNINRINNMSTSSSKSLFSKNEYELNKEKLKEYIEIFKEHLNNKEHPISICIKLFIEVFTKEIEYHLNDIKQISNNNEKYERAKLVSEAITQQLVFFLFKLQKCFYYMYSNVLPFKYFEKEKEEFTIMFSNQFFSNKKLYYLVFQLCKLANESEVDNFQKHINNLKKGNIHPKNININDKFTLDNHTEKIQMDFIIKNNLMIDEEKLIFLKTYYKEENYIPYQSSMNLLKNLKNYQTPYDKIKLLYSMGKNIIDNIMKIWEPLQNNIPKNYLSIDGDELILIFSYIIIYADFPDLLPHLFFIKNFTTTDTKNSMIGYYYTTIEASIIHINDLVEKDYGFEQYEIYNQEKNKNINFNDNEKKIFQNNESNSTRVTKETI